jgi:uncharacterized damage-inducible protein DinB
MTLTELRTWFDYIYWARDRVLNVMADISQEEFSRDLGSSHPSIHETCVHMIGSERLWLARWQGHSPTGRENPADHPTLDAVIVRWRETEADVQAHLGAMQEGEQGRIIEYVTLDGHPVSYPFWQSALQVTNHSSYHRGQVVSMLRQLGRRGVGTDLIMFYRDRNTQ